MGRHKKRGKLDTVPGTISVELHTFIENTKDGNQTQAELLDQLYREHAELQVKVHELTEQLEDKNFVISDLRSTLEMLRKDIKKYEEQLGIIRRSEDRKYVSQTIHG